MHLNIDSSVDLDRGSCLLIWTLFYEVFVRVSLEHPDYPSSTIILGQWPQIKHFLSCNFEIRAFMNAIDTRNALRQEMKRFFTSDFRKY